MKKICLVTGAKKGIGFAITEKLLEYDYKVIMADCEAITEVKGDSNLSVVKSYITK